MKKIFFLAACMIYFVLVATAQKTPPPPPPPPLPPTVEVVKFSPPVVVNDAALETFLKKNPSIDRIIWKNDHIITLQMKDKTSKTYNFWNEKARASFVEKFGDAPGIVPPPPPMPPEPPKKAPSKVKEQAR